ncbi:2-dehydro-3-deoxygalactonokinase [Phyllobacterium endophyticum]|uniref:2-dehydro-3-deoxygalactonokinase n=1 Tax=Phyllobacterium endophyticum TaxID=1149773 RepID=A0A2P7ARU4_9HYPH|nr:2-dehydro-3-deoxygalactonokinase [Phyllobacterium endophyticum]MBB3236568.1 2-dehydro-3-deoxygalactonokinase [Phyllobacterium endophyticum]PSH56890.1 2-dehydro-3-deoxygalactonokinase [Phyllobacterium endophyticum]TYR39567.1 2-dehydro-3-deoxygalactonokinase [Phyllobacterium endophyticum]
MSDIAHYALSDWGTSRFRLWLVDAAGNVIAEKRSDDGLDASRNRGFADTLEGHLSALGAPADLPVIVCGMAGSRQGWVEARYVPVPADLRAILSGAARIENIARDVRIIPGLSQSGHSPNVMRGEETQLLGAILARNLSNRIIAMPGTHSKWVSLQEGRATGFSTYLTGELYALLSSQSILRHSIGDAASSASPDHPQFAASIELMLSGERMLGELFGIRAAMLLDDLSPEGAASRLSGLLIGAEIAGAKAKSSDGITLVASGAMAALYGAALRIAHLDFDLVDADEAVRKGLFVAASSIWPSKG